MPTGGWKRLRGARIMRCGTCGRCPQWRLVPAGVLWGGIITSAAARGKQCGWTARSLRARHDNASWHMGKWSEWRLSGWSSLGGIITHDPSSAKMRRPGSRSSPAAWTTGYGTTGRWPLMADGQAGPPWAESSPAIQPRPGMLTARLELFARPRRRAMAQLAVFVAPNGGWLVGLP